MHPTPSANFSPMASPTMTSPVQNSTNSPHSITPFGPQINSSSSSSIIPQDPYDWIQPGVEVKYIKGEYKGAIAVVMEVFREGQRCNIVLQESNGQYIYTQDKLVPEALNAIEPVDWDPAKGDNVLVIKGNDKDQRGTIFIVEGEEVVITTDANNTVVCHMNDIIRMVPLPTILEQ